MNDDSERARLHIEGKDDLDDFVKHQEDQLAELKQFMVDYLDESEPERPLCVSVFGSPGSGKSRGVKAIAKGLSGVRFHEINLTQLSTPEELAARLSGVATWSEVPFVFFDEFDCRLAGTPLGWLSWFLAPMQDGKFEGNGNECEIPRAIFVFAGGTAHRAAEFGRRDPGHFRSAKGPDFASRLRAFHNVDGPNESPRLLRRASAIRYNIHKELPERLLTEATRKRLGKLGKEEFTISDELATAMLNAGQYLHGDRSIGAILELAARAALRTGKTELTHQHLPSDPVLALHVDRGPLDPKAVGGTIGISANFADTRGAPAMQKVATKLWQEGASLAYFRASADGDAFGWEPSSVQHPQRLSRNPKEESRTEQFVFGDLSLDGSETALFVRLPGKGLPAWKTQSNTRAVELFQMRWWMNARCVARVLCEGNDQKPGSRAAGILEEAMLALATGQPIYVLGHFGNAARHLGGLLGLATKPVLPPPLEFSVSAMPESVVTLAGTMDLPVDSHEIPAYLMRFAIGGDRWPDNGLDVDRNRELFECEDPNRIATLVREGLLRWAAGISDQKPRSDA